jgi:hypothetical protein
VKGYYWLVAFYCRLTESLAASVNFPSAESFDIRGSIVGLKMSKSKSAPLSLSCGILIAIALTPMYEGTPVHLLILPVGLLIGVATYSVISYFILRAALKRRADQS